MFENQRLASFGMNLKSPSMLLEVWHL
jgi:hypothetical protein